MGPAWLRKYGTGAGADVDVPVVKRDSADFAVGADWTPAAGDVAISIDGSPAANITSLPVAVAMGHTAYWRFRFTDAELSGKRIVVTVADAAPKAVEDTAFVIETFGSAVARYPQDPTPTPGGDGSPVAFAGPIRAGVPRLYGCPLPGRPRAFLAPQAAEVTLEHQAVDPHTGAAVDLTQFVDVGGTVVARAAEWFAAGRVDGKNAWAFDAAAVPGTEGYVLADLPAEVSARAGVYRLHFGFKNAAGKVTGVSQAFLLVEPSLFADGPLAGKGPPPASELRLELRDLDGGENRTLRDVEFDDSSLVWGLARAVEFWRSEPPPLTPLPDTRNFPFRNEWARAAVGFVLEMAAQGYRRDAKVAGGVAGLPVDDRDKEKEYLSEGVRRIEAYRQWMRLKKSQIGQAGLFASYGSAYSALSSQWNW